MSEDPAEKKIIIDEDWKTQVEAEREALKQEKSPEPAAESGDQPQGEMPPASFGMLLTTLATEAMVSLGQIPHPTTGEAQINTEAAKYFIDTLAVLQEKTSGNLEPDESQALDDMLHQLRLAFVSAGGK